MQVECVSRCILCERVPASNIQSLKKNYHRIRGWGSTKNHGRGDTMCIIFESSERVLSASCSHFPRVYGERYSLPQQYLHNA